MTAEAVHTVNRTVYTVEEKVRLIRDRLSDGGTVRFDELFEDAAIKMEVVVTFVAILELSTRQFIRLMQTEVNGAIWVTAAGTEESRAEAAASAPKEYEDET